MKHLIVIASSILSGQIPYLSIREPLSTSQYVSNLEYISTVAPFDLYPSFSYYLASIPLVVHTFSYSNVSGVINERCRQTFHNLVNTLTEGRS